jgi:DNA-binding Lrp family transcriptional regulator
MMESGKLDKEVIRLTQAGLPLTKQPYLDIARQLGVTESQVIDCITAMKNNRIIRRIAAVPNHYKIGYVANGMSVWNIPDEEVLGYGTQIGKLDFVSHCYQRPRHPQVWEYNLFAMIHAHDRDEVHQRAGYIAELLGEDNNGYEILFSKRILKKTGLRI